MISVKDAVDNLDRQSRAAAERERILRKCLRFWQLSLSAVEEHVFPLFPGAAQKTEEDWRQVHTCLRDDAPEAVLEGVQVVQNGLPEIIERQLMGWVHLRP